MRRGKSSRRALVFEKLEPRLVLSHPAATVGVPLAAHELDVDGADYDKVILAGFPAGPSDFRDSPEDRVDPNVTASQFTGVGSLLIESPFLPPGFVGLCTGTLIAKDLDALTAYVLTAGHCLDHDDDGLSDATALHFVLNADGPASHIIPSAVDEGVPQFFLHEDFSGFGNPSINDDLGIAKLDLTGLTGDQLASLPAPFDLYRTPVTAGDELTFVGYGESGNPVIGYFVPADPTVKRVGGNVADAFFGQDDPGAPLVNEVFLFDLDGPRKAGAMGPGPLGGPSLGNRIETQFGDGDSGGPSFVHRGGQLFIAGVNTASSGAPFYGSLGVGVLVGPYVDSIDAVLEGSVDGPFKVRSADGAGSAEPTTFEATLSVHGGPAHLKAPLIGAVVSSSSANAFEEARTEEHEEASLGLLRGIEQPPSASGPWQTEASYEDAPLQLIGRAGADGTAVHDRAFEEWALELDLRAGEPADPVTATI